MPAGIASAIPAASALSEMNGAAVYGQRGLVDRLRQSRVRVDGARQILGAGVERHGGHRFGDELRGLCAEDMHTEDPV